MKKILFILLLSIFTFLGCNFEGTISASPDSAVNFLETVDVILSTSDLDATIYYTLDGSDPTEDSAIYYSAITLTETTTINVIAISGTAVGVIESFTYTRAEKVATPTITPGGGSFVSSQEVTLNCGTTEATIYYTLDGTKPTSSSTEYSSVFTITSDTTVNAIAYKTGLETSDIVTNEFTQAAKIAMPTINPDGGSFISSQLITLTFNTNGSIIYYTLDGTEPTINSTQYSNPFSITESTTVKAIGYIIGLETSDVETKVFTEKVATPTISPDGSSFISNQEITLNCGTSEATIYYTLDGTTPTSSSAEYISAFTITEDTTVNAIAYKTGLETSDVVTKEFSRVEKVANPTIDPDGGSFISSQLITLTFNTNGSIIYYTLDGTEPTINSTQYSNAFTITESTTVKAIGYIIGLETSDIVTKEFTGNVATPTISPDGGSFISSQEVTLSCGTTDAIIYYTLDGTIPTSSSVEYSSAFTITADTTVNAIAYKTGLETSDVVTKVFTGKVAKPIISPEDGSFIGTQEVTLSCNTTDATIYYTSDGSTPTVSSTVYSSAFTITADTTVKAIAYKTGLEASEVESKDFIESTPEGFVFIPTAGVSFEVGLTSQADLDDGDEYGDESITFTNSFTNNILIGKYEVAQCEYDALMKIPGSVIDTDTFSSTYGLGSYFPAYSVSWYEAVRYCNELSEAEGLTPYYTITGYDSSDGTATEVTIPTTLGTGYRLPTEAEWEYCAKGGDYESNGRPTYTYAGSNIFDDIGWNYFDSGEILHEVGKVVANGFGLYDMSGNLREWCHDKSINYTSSDKENYAPYIHNSRHVVRGGSWADSPNWYRSVYRYDYPAGSSDYFIGFRVCRYL